MTGERLVSTRSLGSERFLRIPLRLARETHAARPGRDPPSPGDPGHRRRPTHLHGPAGHHAVQGPARLAAGALSCPRTRLLPGHLGHHHPRRRARCRDRQLRRRPPGHGGQPGHRHDPADPVAAGSRVRHRRHRQPGRLPQRRGAPRRAAQRARRVREAGPGPGVRSGAGVLLRPADGGRLGAHPEQDRSRVHDRRPRRPRRPLPPPAAHARPAEHRRLRGQPRVLPLAVRDQPVAQRGDGRRGPDVPVQDGHQGRHRHARDPGNVPRQAVERRGRQRLPPALLADGRRGRQQDARR